MSGVALAWRGVRKAFGPKVVLRDFTLEARPGEALVILGASGSGKSVALRHLVGLTRPDAGEVLVDGRDISSWSERELLAVRRRVAMVFQGGALFDSMTVGENVAFGIHEHDRERPAADVAARVAEVLSLVGLPGTEPLFPASLSGGMRKRVALARALAVGPSAILYDEPTAGLDPVTANKVNQLVRTLQRTLGVTSIVVTHDITSAFHVADRMAYLRDGSLVFDGSVEEARTAPPPLLAAFLAGEEVPPARDVRTSSP